MPFRRLRVYCRTNLTSTLPTVQQKCIPQALLSVDILCQAKSGLGKTAVFVLTTLHQLEPVPGECSVLVMCHTRELAYQIKNEYARFSKYLPDVKTAVFYGGTPIQKDIDLLKNKESFPNIIVGTPGRLNALVRDKMLSLRNVKAFVLDECDKMLDQIGTCCYWMTYNQATYLTICPRHASRRAGDLPSYSYRQTSHDVQRHSSPRYSAHLPKVHEEPIGGLCRRRNQADSTRPSTILHQTQRRREEPQAQ